MEKMHELTISDVEELTKGKKAIVQMTTAVSVYFPEAVIIAEPDSGADGKIILLAIESGCKIELDSNDAIEFIHGNENEIAVTLTNQMGKVNIFITGDSGREADCIINQNELCGYIKDRLDRLSKLTADDIEMVLNMELEFLKNKGLAN